ncbi:AraC family transcriptional regulator [Micromonospora humidisoli]|uniref:helix-turn-helix transcriptional regulator n=1 Tax=Micromonospora sp. AKA109 TaxID=2733865 RepID=UPI0022C760D2|nr:AraC family transcriptional regulator [Micromonospora sp. AKA109]GHJ09284.1 AraC family transcriptional regulator [Micromonospora sp. AKA109]
MVPSGQLTPATRPDLPRPEIDILDLGDLVPGPGAPRPVLLDHDLLVLVTDGHGLVELDFRALPCRPGTLLRATPGQVLRCTARLDAVVLRWRADALRGLDVETNAVPQHHQLTGPDEDAVVNVVSQLVVDHRRHRDDPAAHTLLRHQLAVLLIRLALLADTRNSGGTPDDSDPQRTETATFRRFCREVEAGYPYTRRVEDYAARLGCSVRTLTRACLAVTGRSAKQVVDERVALQARRLLAATDEPVARIGRQLGFPEPTNFGRFFTREVGVSPGAFRAARDRPSTRIVRPRRPADPAEPDGRA